MVQFVHDLASWEVLQATQIDHLWFSSFFPRTDALRCAYYREVLEKRKIKVLNFIWGRIYLADMM